MKLRGTSVACDCRWPQFWDFTVHAGIARKKTCKAEWNQLWVRALNVKWRISEFLFALDSNVVNTEVRPNVESSSGIFWKSLLKLGSKAKCEQGLSVPCCSEVHTHLSSPNPLHLIRSMQTSLLFMHKSNRKDDWCEPWKLLLQIAGEGESRKSFRGTGLG